MRVLIAATAVAAMMAGSLTAMSSQDPEGETTVKDGVFTPGQAARGRERYEASCQRCHGADLTGGRRPVPHRRRVPARLDRTDPRRSVRAHAVDAPRRLREPVRGRLRRHHQLRPRAERFSVGRRRALVRSPGPCSGRRRRRPRRRAETSRWCGSSAAWPATPTPAGSCRRRAPEVRASDPSPSTGDALAEAQAVPLGDRDFKLLYVFPSPDAYLGHKVETKGLLIRDEGGGDAAVDSLNVTSVQGLGEVCE